MELKKESIEAIAKWINSDNTGRSSMYMASVALAGGKVQPAFRPYDPADFRRCYQFMECLTDDEQTSLLAEMKTQSPEWEIIVKNWHNLCAYYLQEKDQPRAPKLYQCMKEIGL